MMRSIALKVVGSITLTTLLLSAAACEDGVAGSYGPLSGNPGPLGLAGPRGGEIRATQTAAGDITYDDGFLQIRYRAVPVDQAGWTVDLAATNNLDPRTCTVCAALVQPARGPFPTNSGRLLANELTLATPGRAGRMKVSYTNLNFPGAYPDGKAFSIDKGELDVAIDLAR